MTVAVSASWLKNRGIPADLVESGYADLDADIATTTIWPSEAYSSGGGSRSFDEYVRSWLPRHLDEHGPAMVAPIRNAQSNLVEALHVRPFAGTGNRRILERPTAPDGTPRGYGWAGACLRADTLIVTEGMADTMSAEALMFDDISTVALGAVSAHDLVVWARWLAGRRRLRSGVRVIVVRHLDGLEHDGVGQIAAREAVNHLVAAGVDARPFHWPAFVRALLASGLDIVEDIERGFDLAAVLRLAHVARFHFDAVRVAFRASLAATTRIDSTRIAA